MKKYCLALVLLAPFCFAEGTAPANTPIPLTEVFSLEENPGAGSLTYTSNNQPEKVEFGKTTGNYGLGMVFSGKALPEPYRKDFVGKQIIQIAYGTVKSKSDGKIPQFGAATLITNKIPTTRTIFRLAVPNSKELKSQNIALLLFTSPSNKSDQSDEEKLKRTLFANSGTLFLSPVNQPSIVTLKNQGAKYTFKRQTMRLEHTADLSTPFSTQKDTLTGIVELQVYSPHGKDAETLAARIATDSLLQGGAGSSPRDTASTPNKK